MIIWHHYPAIISVTASLCHPFPKNLRKALQHWPGWNVTTPKKRLNWPPHLNDSLSEHTKTMPCHPDKGVNERMRVQTHVNHRREPQKWTTGVNHRRLPMSDSKGCELLQEILISAYPDSVALYTRNLVRPFLRHKDANPRRRCNDSQLSLTTLTSSPSVITSPDL